MNRRNLLQLIAFLLPILRKLFEGPRTPELASDCGRPNWPQGCRCQRCSLHRKRVFLKILQEKGYITLNTTNME